MSYYSGAWLAIADLSKSNSEIFKLLAKIYLKSSKKMTHFFYCLEDKLHPFASAIVSDVIHLVCQVG